MILGNSGNLELQMIETFLGLFFSPPVASITCELQKTFSYKHNTNEQEIKQAKGNYIYKYNQHGLPWWVSGKRICLQCRRCKRCEFNPWVGKIPWRRAWQLTPVFLPGESSCTEEPGGLQFMGSQRVKHD